MQRKTEMFSSSWFEGENISVFLYLAQPNNRDEAKRNRDWHGVVSTCFPHGIVAGTGGEDVYVTNN